MSVPAVRRITDGPNHSFFGYYDLAAWDATGRFHLCLQVPFMDRPPTADDEAAICMIDTESGELIHLDRTRAWNFRQSCFLQWRPSAPDREIIFNDRRGEKFVCVVRDVKGGQTRVAGPAIGALSRSGRHGLTRAQLRPSRYASTRIRIRGVRGPVRRPGSTRGWRASGRP